MSEFIRQYTPWIGYIFYSAIFSYCCITVYIYWSNRIRFEITRQAFTDFPITLNFTATNIEKNRNSLDGIIVLKWLGIIYTPKPLYGEKDKHILTIIGNNNIIEPHETKHFQATSTSDTLHYFSSFRHYRFTPNRGMNTHLYFVGTANKNVSRFGFYFRYFLYRFFNVGLGVKPEKDWI